MREFSNRINESWALIRREDKGNKQLAIFIHGFRGSYLSTWGRLPQMLQENADSKPDFQDWDFLFLGYDTKNVSSYLDIAALICTEWAKANNADPPYTQKYIKLVLFGHSLGTLGIRQLLCAWSQQPNGMHEAIHNITLFGTPLNGSPLALFAFGYKIADALKPKSPQLRMLKTWVKSAYTRQPWPKVKIVLGQDDSVVGHEYAELIEWPGDLNPDESTLDHGDLVKPDGWSSKVIDYVGSALRGR